MATILDFRPAAHASSSRSRNLLQGGEIVLFPGVRYQYDTAPAEQESAKPKRKMARKRDKLVLGEMAE